MTLDQWAAIAQIAAAAATIILALLTLGYVIVTYLIVQEMRRAREATDLPYVVAFVEFRGSGGIGPTPTLTTSRAQLAIENVGRRPAFNVQIWRTDGDDWPLPSEPEAIRIPFLPTGIRQYRDAFGSSGPVLSVALRAEWDDEFGKLHQSSFVVEWKPSRS